MNNSHNHSCLGLTTAVYYSKSTTQICTHTERERERERERTLALLMKAPELVLTSLTWLFPESLSATADLFSSDFAYKTKHNKFKTKTQISDSVISLLRSYLRLTIVIKCWHSSSVKNPSYTNALKIPKPKNHTSKSAIFHT